MIRIRRLTAAAAAMLVVGAHSLMACAKPALESAPDPRTWAPIACASCVKAGVTVEVRRSIDEEGRAGRYVFARVSNQNPHAVVFDFNLLSHRAAMGDPDFLMPGWRLTLSPAGDASAATTVVLDRTDVAIASVSAMERF